MGSKLVNIIAIDAVRRDWVTRGPLLLRILAFCLFGIAFHVAYRYAMSFSQTTASPFWFPDSILLCALLLAPSRYWPLLILAPLPVRLFSDVSAGLPSWFLLATYAVDSAKGLLAATLLRRLTDNPLRVETIGQLARYTLIAVLLVPAVAATGGAAARHLLGHDYWLAWVQWFSGNALTHLIITPVILYWLIAMPWKRPWPSKARRYEAAILASGLLLTTWLAFASDAGGGFTDSRYYAHVPFLVWAAVRFGMAGATAGIATITVVAIESVLTGNSSFSAKTPQEVALALQEFLLVRAAPLYLVAVLFDQMRRTERLLRASEQRYREVVNTQTDLVCRFLPDTTLTFVNAAYCRYFGRTREQLIGTRFIELLPEDARDGALEEIALAASKGKAHTYEHEVNAPGGARRWHEWTDYPICDAGGQLIEFQSIGHDITDRKLVDEARQNLVHASRLAAVGQLTAVLAHEITQPLNAAMHNAQTAARLLKSSKPNLRELREIVSDICRNHVRAGEVIDRIRLFARNRSIRMQPLDINATVQDVLRLMRADAARRKIRIVVELDPSVPLVSGDRVHLQQVILNLIVNAMDAIREGPSSAPQITVQTRKAESAENMVEVVVSDHGRGVSPHRLGRIFEAFFTTKGDGMGIGLAISRSIIDAHGGRIWAESRPGEATKFRFVLRKAEGEVVSQDMASDVLCAAVARQGRHADAGPMK